MKLIHISDVLTAVKFIVFYGIRGFIIVTDPYPGTDESGSQPIS